MALSNARVPNPLAGLVLALATAALVLHMPPTQCPVTGRVNAYAPSVSVSACGVGVTFSL
mgnify:CR=1 FL=1